MTAQPAPGESPGPAFAVACMTAQRLHGRAALTRWVAHIVPGEVLGFSIAAGAGAAAWALDAPITLLVLAVVAGGSIEGGCLGYAQARALRRILPGVAAARWVAATAAGAAVAWACGMTAGSLPDLGAPVWLSVAGWVLAAPVILLAIGGPQAWVLRGLVPRAWRWIAVNVVGWLVALPSTFIAGLFVDESTPAPVVLGTFIAAGLVMAAIIAVNTGAGLLWMLRSQPPRST